MRVAILTSREPGLKCLAYAQAIAERNRHIQIVGIDQSPDIVISVLYEKLLTDEYIKKVPLGCYNFHPGKLPEYRGAGYFSWSIINGEKRGYITFHRIDQGMDTGEIIDTATWQIDSKETGYSNFIKGTWAMFHLFNRWFERIVKNNLEIRTYPQEGKAKSWPRSKIAVALNMADVPMSKWGLYARAFYFPPEMKKSMPYLRMNDTTIMFIYHED